MAQWILLLRGINVGGRGKLPMKSLGALLEDLGCTDVRTYIQSGNVVLESTERSAKKLQDAVASAVAAGHGFEPQVLALKPADFEKVRAANPFPDCAAEADGKALHAMFLGAIPKPGALAGLDEWKHPSEKWKHVGKALYLYSPDGFHKSKLAAKADRSLDVPVTTRNWRTVSKIAAMLEE